MLKTIEIEVTDENLLFLRQFYHGLYIREFPDPDERELLANMERYLRLKAEGWYGKNNYHIFLLIEGETPVAGSISDYLADANSGVIEFLVVSPEYRGRSLGRRLLALTEEKLAEDAKRNCGRSLDYIVGEMNDPYKAGSVPDNLDPFERAKIWHRRGYQRLDFPYLQPALSPEQQSVPHLLLMSKVLNPAFANGLLSATVKRIVHEYIRWAMRIDNPEECQEFQAMAKYLDAREIIGVEPLGRYVSLADSQTLDVEPVLKLNNRLLTQVTSVYRASFGDSQVTIALEDFGVLLRSETADQDGFRYHLWALKNSPKTEVEGMASFFTFPGAGFGGYVALTGSMRGMGYLGPLMRRMEREMVTDSLNSRGWYIECEPGGRERLFAREGFRTIAVRYRQPPLAGKPEYGLDNAPQLCLMYKEFGRNYGDPEIAIGDFFDSLKWIFRVIYHIGNPQESSYYADIRNQIASTSMGSVPFKK
ncbi:MAG: GNAT family N-acetyltransferase [Methylococcales bacterium]